MSTNFTPPPATPPVSGNSDGPIYLVPAGSHQARLVWLIITGTVDTEFQGEKKKKKEVIFGFELPTTLLPGDHPRKGEPCFMSKYMTYHMSEKANMRGFIESWRGAKLTDQEAASYDLSKLISQPAVITVSHDPSKKDSTKIYANIRAIISEKAQQNLMPGFKVAPQVNKSIYLSVDWLSSREGAEYFMNIFNDIPKYVQDKIMLSDEWKAYTRQPFYIAPAVIQTPATSNATTQATPESAPETTAAPGFQDLSVDASDDLPF